MGDARIETLVGRRIWDSRGRPTVEVEVLLKDGSRGSAIAPAGASTGSAEAIDLRDQGPAFGGYDVTRAIANVNGEIRGLLHGQDALDQDRIDRMLVDCDGTPNKSRLGGNATIATSMAVLHAAAAASGLPLWSYLAKGESVTMPLPETQIFGGGAHAARRVDIQDFMVMAHAAGSFSEALDWTAEVYRAAGAFMKASGRMQGVADEGGFWPAFKSNEEALDALTRSIEVAGFRPGKDIGISLDVAASEFGANGEYVLALDGRKLDTSRMLDLLQGWLDAYPILSIEDPVAEDDSEGFIAFTRANGRRCQIVGDDYLVTNAGRVRTAAKQKAANAVLIKPNQAGTISEARAAFDEARNAGMATIVSARSGESEDVTVAHLAVGWKAGQLKVGSFSRSERMAKWNECLRIEERMSTSCIFAGLDALGLESPPWCDSTGPFGDPA